MAETTAEARKTIAAPPGRIWAALTDPGTLKQFFFGADIRTDWKVGHAITFSGEYKGKPYEDKGEILAFEPERRLSFSHYSPLTGDPDVPDSYHVVTIELVPAGGGTDVTLTQSNLTGGVRESDRSNRAEYDKNWRSLLDGLDRAATGGAAKA